MKYYIAYGSNLSVEQMAHRCPDAKIIGRASLKNWKLVFKVHATIEPEEGSVVPVLVWQISDRDEQRLDRYEGFPKYYIKQNMTVKVNPLRGNKPVEVNAMVYIMTNIRGITPPSTTYYLTIREGYKRFGFNTDILSNAFTDAFIQYEPQTASNI